MFGFIIMMMVISSLMGNQRGARDLLRGFFIFMTVMFGIRMILFSGFFFIPLLIVVWAVTHIAMPFIKGFISSFRKEGTL